MTISRVPPVTVTSMMFMISIPPTIKALPVDLDHLADGIGASKKIRYDRLPDDGDLARGIEIRLREELTASKLIIPHRGKVLTGAGQTAVPVLVPIRQLGPTAGTGNGRHDV